MDRLACVNVPSLPLQLLLAGHPDWRGFPAAVVDRDTPQGKILWTNARAWKVRIRPGQRYSDCLQIAPDLRAGVVSEAAVKEGVATLTERMQRFTPEVEPDADGPGTFWLGASGLSLIFPSLDDWSRAMCEDLSAAGFRASVVTGFTRFGTYALVRSLAHSGRRAVVIKSPTLEAEAARQVSLEHLGLDPKLRDMLAKLGIKTVGTFLRLPAAGLRRRFGEEAYRLHRMAGGEAWTPLAPQSIEEPIEQKVVLDEPVVDVHRLTFMIKGLLDPVLEQLASREEAVAVLHLLFTLDSRENAIETVRPAEATLDAAVLLDLLQLRLHTSRLPAGVVEIELRVEQAPAPHDQLTLFAATCRRDLDAAARAFARLRAELGEGAVVRARLREGHLPEAGFTWEPMHKLGPARPRKVAVRTLIRRIQARAVALPPRPRNERNDNWLMQGLEYGPVARFMGPYIVSGGWWMSTVHREYHFVETRRGDLLWTYYDRKRRRWYLHGTVE